MSFTITTTIVGLVVVVMLLMVIIVLLACFNIKFKMLIENQLEEIGELKKELNQSKTDYEELKTTIDDDYARTLDRNKILEADNKKHCDMYNVTKDFADAAVEMLKGFKQRFSIVVAINTRYSQLLCHLERLDPPKVEPVTPEHIEKIIHPKKEV